MVGIGCGKREVDGSIISEEKDKEDEEDEEKEKEQGNLLMFRKEGSWGKEKQITEEITAKASNMLKTKRKTIKKYQK